MNDSHFAAHCQSVWQDCRDQLPGQQLKWLSDAREQELNHFIEEGVPTPKNEQWKYTDLSLLQQHSLTYSPLSRSTLSKDELTSVSEHRLVFVDGSFQSSLSTLKHLPPAVILTSFSVALSEHTSLIKQYFKKSSQASSFYSLNSAFINDGLFLYVPANVVIKEPIHILYITTASQPQMMHLRQMIIAEAGSECCVFEQYTATTTHIYFNNVVTHIIANEGANIQHIKFQDENKNAFHVAHTEIEQAHNSFVKTYNISLGGKISRDDLHVDLQEKNAECLLRGLYLPGYQQHIDHHTRIDHRTSQGCSDEFYKGIIAENARAVFNGKVIVHPGAQKTNAHQCNKNLLLSTAAEIDTKPELEIYADDVKCTHGATTGQLDEEALFYLRARGIDMNDAKCLLMNAFVTEIVNEIPVFRIQEIIRQAVCAKLSHMLTDDQR